uniref:cellulase n=1 Tax=Diabrotica virgifera virgifera TaxID=50390 RepID=A0A4D6QBH3_DIAVI|nr:glycoside hydrolase family 45 protein [Diabrotica virgifera virgifera]
MIFIIFSLLAFVGLAPSIDALELTPVEGGLSGNGSTSRYWDCCKPACAWPSNVPHSPRPVTSCKADGITPINPDAMSGCENGTAYTCTNQQPFIVNQTYGYGFAAAYLIGGSSTNNFCCACFLLNFTDQIKYKHMVVQVTNSGTNFDKNEFVIALPGSGVGDHPEGCHDQWNAPWTGWGDQYGGVHMRSECVTLLPEELQEGCKFRFDFMETAANPLVSFQQVVCPDELVKISGCRIPE